MKLLDLFCGAGGCAVGYYRAGFHDITGVDINPQPRYPYDFIQGDAMEYLASHGHEYDFIHSSPPCQFYSNLTPTDRKAEHPDMIDAVRQVLQATGKPFVIENVAGAKGHLQNPLMLCGTMFGLNLWRHRYFEIWPEIFALLPPCQHVGYPVLISGVSKRKDIPRRENSAAECREASGIDWMTRREMDEAIPPAYTQWIGGRFLESMGA